MNDLSARHRKFADSYLSNGFDPRAAYISAGYSEKSADSEAYRLLRKPEVQAHIKGAFQPAATAQSIVQRLVDIAFFNLADIVDTSDGVKLRAPFSELPKHMTACIESISESDGKLTIKRESSIAALRILAKHFAVDLNPKEIINAVHGLGFEVLDQSPLAIAHSDDDEDVTTTVDRRDPHPN